MRIDASHIQIVSGDWSPAELAALHQSLQQNLAAGVQAMQDEGYAVTIEIALIDYELTLPDAVALQLHRAMTAAEDALRDTQ